MTTNQPIAALASGTGAAAVAVIRLSGEGCHRLLAPLLAVGPAGPVPAADGRPEAPSVQGLGGASLDAWPERQMRLARVIDPESGEVVDEALVVLFRGRRSFTGEDAAEIQAHGGPYIVQRLLALLYRRGFRPAEPGEFTRRAFLRGKLDLTAAEGIRELVEAQSHQQWVAARHLASGRLRQAIESLRTQLIDTLAYLEAQIDFPDEGDTAHVGTAQATSRAGKVRTQIQQLLATYDSGRVASQGLMVTLFGAPNAGKSTLLNELLGRERAIVTPIAGTTRDYLEERCLVEGRLIRLFDMAGIRDNPDPIEAIGVEAARRLAGEADLVIFLAAADGPEARAAEVDRWLRELAPRDHLKVMTKADLGTPDWAQGWLTISCQSGFGLDALRKALAAKVDRSLGDVTREASFVTSARHAAALREAGEALDGYFAALERGEFVECLAFEVQQAVRALKGIVGEVGSEDVLDQVFREFCVGK